MIDDNLRKKLRISVLAAAMAALPMASAQAAGLGRLTVLSALGQPLRAELDISASREEAASLVAKVASQESFRQANIEYSGLLSGLRFTLDHRPNGQPYFRVSSDRVISEPFLDILVELNWSSGRLVREYTFLLDPPELNKPAEAPNPVTPPVAAPVAPAPFVAPPPPVAVPRPESERPRITERRPAPARPETRPETRPEPKVAPSAEKPSADKTHVVKSGDTLAKVAAATRPEGVNLDQMLVALYRNNQDAFEGGNMNRLKAGKILAVPDKETAAAVDAAEARKTVLAQAADFENYRRKLAGAAAQATPARAAPAQQSSGGRITPKVEDKAPAAAGKDKLQVSKAEGDNSRLKTLEEEKVVREKALKDAQGRISELEKNLADLRKLAELKSQAAADLEKQAAAAKAAAAEAAKKAEAAKAPPAKPEAPKPETSKPEAPKPAETPKAAEEPKPAESAPPKAEEVKPVPDAPKAEAPKPAPPKPKAPVVADDEEEAPGFIEENPSLVFGGAGIVALLAAYLGIAAWRRKKARAEEAVAGESVLSTNSSVLDVTSSEGLSRIDDQPSEFGPLENAAFGSGEGVDPVREAETFLAYGRDDQAEEILRDALVKTPDNLPVRLKLLEIYAGRRNVGQFNAVAADLHAQTGGHGPEWDKAKELGQGLDPTNPLYGAAPASDAAAAPADLAALDLDFDLGAPTEPGSASAAEPEAGLDIDLGEAPALEETLVPSPAASTGLDFDLDIAETPAAQAAPAVAEPAAVDAGLDFDLGEAELAPAAASADAPAALAAGNDGLDFNLDLPAAEPAAESVASPATETPAAPPLDLDFDLELPPASAAEAAPAPAAEPAPEAAALDFDFNLDLPAAQPTDFPAAPSPASAAPGATAAEPAPAEPEALDLSAIDLDLPALSEPSPAEALPASAEVPAEPESVAEAQAEPDLPEVTTKLELAQAYEEMGDLEGAKELLQEVLNEGSPAQKAAAQAKLAVLG